MIVAVLGLLAAGLNIAYWVLVVLRGEPHAQAWVEKRYGVVITRGWRGHWQAAGHGSKLRLLGIELLQLVYFLGAFVVWAVGMGLMLGLIAFVQR